MLTQTYLELREDVIAAGYAEEVLWAETVKPCRSAAVFRDEYVWVVLNSGMKNQVARIIRGRIVEALEAGRPVLSAFRHPGKAAAIEAMLTDHALVFGQYLGAVDKLAFLQSLPWIGPITKYHLAKNLGLDYAKPDRHLERIAGSYGMTTNTMCGALAIATGQRIGVVDYVIWRAANLRML